MIPRIRDELRDVWCMLTRRCEWLNVERIRSEDQTVKWLYDQEQASLRHIGHLPSLVDEMRRKGQGHERPGR